MMITEGVWGEIPAQKSVSHIVFIRLFVFKFVDTAHYHIQCIYLKGLSGPMRHHFPTQLEPSTKTREKWSRWMGSLENVCGVEEEVRGGSLHTWWCVSDQSNSVPMRAEALKDANVSSTDLCFSLSINSYSNFASSVGLPASHCQAGALISDISFLSPFCNTKSVSYICTVQHRM